MNMSNLNKSIQYHQSPEERYYSNKYTDHTNNGTQMNRYHQMNQQYHHLQNSYSNPRLLHQQNQHYQQQQQMREANGNNNYYNNNGQPQYPPVRMSLPRNYSNWNIRYNTPVNNYVSDSMRLGRGRPRQGQLPDQSGLNSKLFQIEKKMNQIEKQSQRIEAFNDIFFKLFPSSTNSKLEKGLPRIIPQNKQQIQRQYQANNNSLSKINNPDNGNNLNLIDAEFSELKKEIGNRLARIREKQKLQTDAIQYILKHSGNPNFYSNYMNC